MGTDSFQENSTRFPDRGEIARQIMQTIPVGIAIVNADGLVVEANARAQHILGLTVSEDNPIAYNDPAWKITDFDGHPFPDDRLPFRTVKKTGAPVFDVRHAVVSPDGKKIFLSVNASPLFDDRGEFSGMIASLEDISAAREAEARLRQSENRLLTVLNSIDTAIFVNDMTTHEILFMNRYMIDTFGQDFTGRLCHEVIRNESSPCPVCTAQDLLDENGEPAGPKVWQGFNPVSRRHYIHYDRAIEWIDGRMVKIQVAMDTTELKTMEKELLQAQKLEAIGILAGGIAHDFNNILFPILGLTELLLDSDMVSETAIPHLNEIRKASNRAKELIRQILTISRKNYSHSRIPVDIRSMTKEIIKLARSTLPSTIRIIQKIAKDCPPVMADPAQIHQVILNLITNAFHAMEKTGGVLTLTLAPVRLDQTEELSFALSPGQYIVLTVADTGTGMDPSTLDSIFDPYFSTKEKHKGTGLGLSIVKGVLAGIEGDIFVESTPGKGTVFSVYIPAYEAEEEIQSPNRPDASASGTESVMVIDDEDIVGRTIQMILQRHGYKVQLFKSSPAALETFYHYPDLFDLVITDMTMPDMTGMVLAEKFTRIRPGIPIILLTGYEKNISEQDRLACGIVRVMTKPVSKSRLLETIREVLA